MKLSFLILMLFVASAAAQSAPKRALVHDPTSNVREGPGDRDFAIQCSITKRGQTINLYEKKHGWYATDACGKRGWIAPNQVRIFTVARVKPGAVPVRSSPNSAAALLCEARDAVRVYTTSGAWRETDYCGVDTKGWVQASKLGPPPPRAESSANAMVASVPQGCAGDAQCTAVPTCADPLSGKCISDQCQWDRNPVAGCPCFDTQVRSCPTAVSQFNVCTTTGPGTAAWQAECGPRVEVCDPKRPSCPSGKRITSYQPTPMSSAWVWGTCIPDESCPKEGESQECKTGNVHCPTGLRTYTLASGWSACTPVGSCTPSPLPSVTDCRPGESSECQTGEGCPGRRFCNAQGTWDTCNGRLRCPLGWSNENGQCMWHSPAEGTAFSYFPQHAANNAVAATAAIGHPAAGNQPGPIYLQANLAQWSHPAAANNGNYCGKGNHVSTFVGCIRPDGSRAYGRDVADHEWEAKVMIELRCEPGDLVGIHKYTWGHDLSRHCTRQLSIGIARNHDSIDICRW